MKTYVLTVSKHFPKTHKRAGDHTNFPVLINNKQKLHTIRGNYGLWRKHFDKIEKGEACLSVRVWTGVPYNSSQVEIFNFCKEDGIGIEKLEDPDNMLWATIGNEQVDWGKIS